MSFFFGSEIASGTKSMITRSMSASTGDEVQTESKVVDSDANTCSVCSMNLFHYGYQAMNLGCACSNKVCKQCVTTGNITACPTCRKTKRNPVPDNKWKRRKLSEDGDDLLECFGCKTTLPAYYIEEHERTCTKCRDVLETELETRFVTYRDRAATYEGEIDELNDRINYQAEQIDELELVTQGVHVALSYIDAERKAFNAEHNKIVRTINRIQKPLKTVINKVNQLDDELERLKNEVTRYKTQHDQLNQRRQLFGSTSERFAEYLSSRDTSGNNARTTATVDNVVESNLGVATPSFSFDDETPLTPITVQTTPTVIVYTPEINYQNSGDVCNTVSSSS